VGSAGVNKKSSDVSAVTGLMPLFFKPLAAFSIFAAFPYAVQKSELIWYCLTLLPGITFSHFETY
jgi:hypothetical protein